MIKYHLFKIKNPIFSVKIFPREKYKSATTDKVKLRALKK